MPIVAMQLNKVTGWQGGQEQFSNVYTLNSGVDFSDNWRQVAIDLATVEAAVSSTEITAESYTVWNLEGTKIERVILDAGDISVPGTRAPDGLYKECAYLVRWPLSRSPVLRRRRWLSKWVHTGTAFGGTNTHRSGETPLSETAMNSFLDSYARPISSGAAFTLPGVVFCDGNGEEPGEPFMKPYLEHRQFHR